ncbi:caspase family protein [Magnetospirillum sp. UT-4]|uniref:caspase family protein n=1 Tax=Magnetospirillum sp. UT-4 TaxID=2681467 RepID=UPI0013807F4B|nr:caspase family protein [Magnetospirillum sp. UT-4]CAA7614627.1 conserved exported hypothetical protein [Magnetospirillum sp. UT-4]
MLNRLLAVMLVLLASGGASADTIVNAHSVAVIIGNRIYASDQIPAVEYAHRDADAMKRYLVEVLGYRTDNVIDLRDATQSQLESVLGNSRTFQGKLWQFVKAGQSDIVVYFSGHGAPGMKDRKGYLLPTDADPSRPEINGYPIDLLMDNLAKIDAKSRILFIDACFSGATPKGSLVASASAIHIVPKAPVATPGLIALTAGQTDQIASWDEKNHHGLFTEHLLDGLYGRADAMPYGNADGKVTAFEVKAYLDDVMTYAARREHGRIQVASLYAMQDTILVSLPNRSAVERPRLPNDAEPQVAVRGTPSGGNSTTSTAITNERVMRGGRLYDNWYKELAVSRPNDPHPAYPLSGKAPKNSWRCPACHGWDYTGERAVGFQGVVNAKGMSEQEIVRILRSAPHSYPINRISDSDLLDLAAFISHGQIDMSLFIDLQQNIARGRAELGKARYLSECVSCHGEDGKQLPGALPLGMAADYPAALLHKIVFGQPGETNHSFNQGGAAHLLAYIRTLPR